MPLDLEDYGGGGLGPGTLGEYTEIYSFGGINNILDNSDYEKEDVTEDDRDPQNVSFSTPPMKNTLYQVIETSGGAPIVCAERAIKGFCNGNRRNQKPRNDPKAFRWVPHELSERQQERRLVTCEGLLARHEKKSFLHRIVTSDEKWIHFSNPMRQKSWDLPGQFPKQTPRPNRFRKKAMLCVWWDQTGVVYFELLKPGETVNTSRYEQQMHSLREALNEKRPECREKHNKLNLQHDNAPAHSATVVKNTIKDLGWELLPHPSDYHLFTSLGHALKNQEFSNSDTHENGLLTGSTQKE
ncbi:hypothetical protein LAZ67_9002418 [Cordylochernes scorpioides]|uniref:Transposase n=1 Tax=Cordylochernes scorpioides TaxID=51811 RepID=A0ABY6KWJ6_9ARAC|nr:hypothetical protein LAZ67_9002412 [Cordylochernes scorpioides]UYV72272.1 hypothetical protein LAZ67_9002418 [Cordylochernes scorpioides]